MSKDAFEQATPDSEVQGYYLDAVRVRARHLAQLGVSRWHAAGFRGKGVKIGVLDSGFRGYRVQLGHALPAEVVTHSFRADGDLEAKDSQHGILCGEVLHALAPDADLCLANWDADHPEQFLEAVRWARRQGARVLSCSLIMPSWSDGEGGGATHAALAALLGTGYAAQDMLCFASAGNTAQRHWCGAFHPAADGFHEWQPGREENELMPWGADQVSVELCTHPGASYEVQVIDEAAGGIAARSVTQPQTGPASFVARFQPAPAHAYKVRVRHLDGAGDFFHLVALGAGLQFTVARSSIPFPADGTEVIAVGAVDEQGRRLGYSSCGPNSSRPKPDLMAPVPFPSLWRSRPFSGTSASAPQAAGLAALIWSKQPVWNASQVWQALRASARDLNAPGHDFETGYGLIQLP